MKHEKRGYEEGESATEFADRQSQSEIEESLRTRREQARTTRRTETAEERESK